MASMLVITKSNHTDSYCCSTTYKTPTGPYANY